MAHRLRSIFPNIHGEVFTVYVDDSSYVGSVVDVDVSNDGFTHAVNGDSKNLFTPVLGSNVALNVLVTNAVASALGSFATDLKNSAEGRFTLRIDYQVSSGGAASLYWVGYILPDFSGFQDLETYIFSITATDGIGRLKGIEYKDSSGASDAPYGMTAVLNQILTCLNQDPLSALYFSTSDVFLRTVVNWQDTRIGAPSAALCPTTRTRFSGEVFATRDTSNDGKGWKFKSCFDVLEQICIHYAARLSFSSGSYRFEQVNERSQDLFMERRFSRTGTLVSSSAAMTYDKAVNQNYDGFKIATIQFNYLAALKKVTVDYDHNTYRNYLAGLSYKWYATSGDNSAFTRTNIKFDSDSYFRISGRVNVDLSVSTYTEPWRYIFAMELSTNGGYKLRSFTDAVVDGSGNGINVIKREPVDWQISSVWYEISTDFQYSNQLKGYINFSLFSPIVPAGESDFTIDFYPIGGEDNQNNNHGVTLNNWQFTDLVMNIVGVDDANNYEANRKYYANNPTSGNSQTLEVKELFGAAVKPWTPSKIQTSADGSTWLDTDATWKQGTNTTAYEFGALLAAELMSAQTKPVTIMSGSINGKLLYAHSRVTLPDTTAWLMMSGTYTAALGTWSGDWQLAGVDRFTGSIITRKVAQPGDIPPGTSGTGEYNPAAGQIGATTAKGNIALAAVTTNHLSTAIAAGTITSIALEFPVAANAYLAGDDIFVVNPATGEMVGMTVAATATEGATSLSIVSTTIPNGFPQGAHIVYSALNKTSNQGGNGQNLPAGTDGQILRHDSTKWAAYSGAADGHVLIWRTATGWGSEAPPTGGGGTVTSVALSLPASIITVTGSPVTTSGTLTGTLATQTANLVWAGPTTGSAAAPTFRALVAADIPNLDAAKITTGTFPIARGGTGLSALGTALQLLRVNAGATALEYFTATYLTANQTITLSGDVTGSGSTAITTTISAGAVTLAKMENRATQTFIGRNTAGTGVPEELSVATAKTMLGLSGTNTGDQTITLTGDVTGSGTGSFAATISANAVTDAKLRQSAGLSVIGRASNTTGNVADITAVTDGHVLRLSGTTLGFGQVVTAGIANSAVTLVKMENRATQTFIGRNTAGTGVPEELSVATAKTMLGLSGTNTGDQTITLTGDVTGSGTASFAATISAGAVTYAKMQNISATQRLLGRNTAGAGVTEEVTATQVLDWLGATQGSILYRGVSAWTVLAPGTAGQVLQTNGAAANPSWATAGGGVTGTGSDGHVAYWTSTTNISFDSSQLFWDATNNRLGIGTASPASGLHVGLATGTSDEGLRVLANLSANLNNTIQNSNNANAAANALLNISVGGTSAGDPVVQLSIPGSITWSVGLDNSDSDAFVIATNSVPGTGNRLRIATTGQVSINSGSATATVNIGGLGATSATYSMLVNNSSGSSVLALRDDRRVGILNVAPTQELDVSGDVIARQYMNTAAAPTFSLGTGAGTGASVPLLDGGVNFIRLAISVGTSPVANGDIITITVNQPFPTLAVPVLFPFSANAASEITKFYVSALTAQSFTLKANGTLVAGSLYQFLVMVGGF